jgi:hypothetical protein
MKCAELQEFLSSLCDGERIPPQAAEHISSCRRCRERMNEYSKIGAELRRAASVEIAREVRPGAWRQVQPRASRSSLADWWGKGRETMQIPKFAFALLLVAVVALGSGLLIDKVRAQSQGTVLMLTTKIPSGESNRCALSLVDEKNNFCAWMDPTQFLFGLKAYSYNGDQIELGVRAKYTPVARVEGTAYSASLDDLYKVPEKRYSLKPGEALQIEIPGWGNVALSGELMDHMPPSITVNNDVRMDPKPGTLQVISPLLLRDNKVFADFEGGSAINNTGAQMYVPGEGLWTLSLSPIEGAMQAKVNLNRVSFELNGHSYTILMAAPVARTEEHVWVLHDPKYELRGTSKFIGPVDVARYFRKDVETGARSVDVNR